LPGSSVAEQVTVNHLVAGSIPARAAIRRASASLQLAHGLRPAYSICMNGLVAEARRMAPSLSRGTAVAYFLRLRSGTIYIGASVDLEQRLEDHLSGQACETTKLDPPVGFIRVEILGSLSEARRREAQIKRWSRAKKEALVSGALAALKALSRSRD
jgi:putative endonuclease